MKKRNLNQNIQAWLPLGVAIVIIMGFVTLAVQQSYRQSANDPQVQMASDAVRSIKAGDSAQALVNTTPVDPAFSLKPFMMIFDESGQPVASGATLAEKTPLPPAGVFDNVRRNGEERFTWQPAGGVRIAVVMQHVSGDKGFVLTGRSLGEVERREQRLMFLALAALVAALGLSYITVMLVRL